MMETPTFTYNPDLPIYDVVSISKPIYFYTWLLNSINLLFLGVLVFDAYNPSSDRSLIYSIQGVLIALVLLNLYLVFKKRNAYQNFIKNSVKTTATLVGKNVVESADDDISNTYFLFYQFDPSFTVRAELKLKKMHTGQQMADYYHQFKEGDKITVYYKPENPKENIPAFEEYKKYKLF